MNTLKIKLLRGGGFYTHISHTQSLTHARARERRSGGTTMYTHEAHTLSVSPTTIAARRHEPC